MPFLHAPPLLTSHPSIINNIVPSLSLLVKVSTAVVFIVPRMTDPNTYRVRSLCPHHAVKGEGVSGSRPCVVHRTHIFFLCFTLQQWSGVPTLTSKERTRSSSRGFSYSSCRRHHVLLHQVYVLDHSFMQRCVPCTRIHRRSSNMKAHG